MSKWVKFFHFANYGPVEDRVRTGTVARPHGLI
jgi:hypothetical protein